MLRMGEVRRKRVGVGKVGFEHVVPAERTVVLVGREPPALQPRQPGTEGVETAGELVLQGALLGDLGRRRNITRCRTVMSRWRGDSRGRRSRTRPAR